MFFRMLSLPIAYMCELYSQLGFRSPTVVFFACFHFRDPTCVNHILNLDSGVEFCVYLDVLTSESLYVWTIFTTCIQVFNGCVFWMLSLPRAYMSEPDSQLGFRYWMVMCFGCFHFREPTCVNHILNVDSGVEFCVYLDALTSEILHVWTRFSTWI